MEGESSPPKYFGDGPKTVLESTVSNTELSEFFCPHRVPGREPSEFLLFVGQSELTEFFAELTEFAAELGEFSLPKQYSQNITMRAEILAYMIYSEGPEYSEYIIPFFALSILRPKYGNMLGNSLVVGPAQQATENYLRYSSCPQGICHAFLLRRVFSGILQSNT